MKSSVNFQCREHNIIDRHGRCTCWLHVSPFERLSLACLAAASGRVCRYPSLIHHSVTGESIFKKRCEGYFRVEVAVVELLLGRCIQGVGIVLRMIRVEDRVKEQYFPQHTCFRFMICDILGFSRCRIRQHAGDSSCGPWSLVAVALCLISHHSYGFRVRGRHFCIFGACRTRASLNVPGSSQCSPEACFRLLMDCCTTAVLLKLRPAVVLDHVAGKPVIVGNTEMLRHIRIDLEYSPHVVPLLGNL